MCLLFLEHVYCKHLAKKGKLKSDIFFGGKLINNINQPKNSKSYTKIWLLASSIINIFKKYRDNRQKIQQIRAGSYVPCNVMSILVCEIDKDMKLKGISKIKVLSSYMLLYPHFIISW
jgi:hypothetical protein